VEGIVFTSALFYNTGIPASIWIINKKQTEAQKRQSKPLLMPAVITKERQNQNELLPEHLKLVKAHDGAHDVDNKYMRIVSIGELAGKRSQP
jgi:type I restriction enzyme M protein